MAHPKTIAWERRLSKILKQVDMELEDRYGDDYPLHPSRQPEGNAANPQYDGLFSVTASFSAGFGSENGPGYIIEVRMVTLSDVPDDIVDKIEDEAASLIRKALPLAFKGRDLHVDRDGAIYKIYGDLSLGGGKGPRKQ